MGNPTTQFVIIQIVNSQPVLFDTGIMMLNVTNALVHVFGAAVAAGVTGIDLIVCNSQFTGTGTGIPTTYILGQLYSIFDNINANIHPILLDNLTIENMNLLDYRNFPLITTYSRLIVTNTTLTTSNLISEFISISVPATQELVITMSNVNLIGLQNNANVPIFRIVDNNGTTPILLFLNNVMMQNVLAGAGLSPWLILTGVVGSTLSIFQSNSTIFNYVGHTAVGTIYAQLPTLPIS